MGWLIDRRGERYGRLVVVSQEPSISNVAYWRCRCDCGRETVVRAKQLARGMTASCGCLASEALSKRNTVHGLSRAYPREYRTWKDMRARCRSATKSDYADYGGRGITVCARWERFEDFFADMGERPAGMTLDRIDVNGNYELANCRWATAKVQANNKRSSRAITWNGETKTLAEWCALHGVDHSKARYRLSAGWPLDRVFNPGAERR